jgi:hypothetical protein
MSIRPAPIALAWLLLAATAFAQPLPDAAPPLDLQPDLDLAEIADQPSPPRTDTRACDGCPPRGVGRSLLQTTGINVIYGLANLARGQATARITPKTWWVNMENGWVWDLDEFGVNQIGHPYQGSNYYNAGRANGLSFYESAAMTAFGSATWEYFGETNHASLNDLINTTLGGIAIGEVLHRAAWLIRDPRASGRGRVMREIGATIVDPVTGYNRFRSGDASRIADKPAEMVPSATGTVAAVGVLWRGTEERAVNSSGQPFVEVDLLYGDLDGGRSRTPYDAFTMRLRLGGGGPISDAKVRGRLIGQPLRGGALQFTVAQSYDFLANDAYHFGAQSFEGIIGVKKTFSPRVALRFFGSGGLTVLGAINSLPPGVDAAPDEEVDPDAPQGVSEGPRHYDYGPGSNFSGAAILTRDRDIVAAFLYEGRHLYSLDGVRANHFLQHIRADLQWPLRGPLGLGVSGEYFSRHTYFQDAERTEGEFWYPQFRAFLTWSLR